MLFAAAIVASLAGPSVASFLPRFGVTALDDRALIPGVASGCSTTGPASCSNTSSVSDLCCFESPGGLLLQTQFWDTSPPTGPNDSWTIHGLWPDNCDTTFTENCDPSRAYTGIASLLTAQGAVSTLSFMQTFWKDINGNDETFWEHEWSTHGTCMSTLNPTCLFSGSPQGAEAVAFFQTVVTLFQTLPTFTWLSNQGITPSSTATYTLASLTTAIEAESGVGFTPVFKCSGSTLNAIQYYFHLRGSIIDGAFQQIDAPESGSCPTSGIKYPLKTHPTGGCSTDGNPPGLPAKATIHASSTGGLLSLGTWSTQTLATFMICGTMDSFVMTSSQGNCGVSDGTFACGSEVSPTSFSAVTSGSTLVLASGGSTAWTSDGVPSGTTVLTVFTGSGHGQDYTLSIVSGTGGCSTDGVQDPPKLPAKATIHASSIGGLLSLGTWSTQTLATFTISGTMDSFTMTSSKGNCSVSGGTFMCGSGLSLTSFSAVTSGSCLLLASGGSTAWSSDGMPSGTTMFPVFAGSDRAQEYMLFIVST